MDQLGRKLAAGIEERKLPEFLREPLLQVAAFPARHESRRELVALLLEQVLASGCYASSGCFKEGYDAEGIKMTLAKLEG